MILVDCNVISTFAKIKRLELLFKVFNKSKLHISANVFQELMIDKERGYEYTSEIFNRVEEHKIEIVTPTEDELLFIMDMPKSFGSGELDSLAICKTRGAIFLSNERKVINYCQREKIICFDLCDILAALWKYKVLEKGEVVKMIEEIEKKDNVYIPSKARIFPHNN